MVSGNCRYTGVAKTYHGTNCFLKESQYTDIPVISPSPSQNISFSAKIVDYTILHNDVDVWSVFPIDPELHFV